MNNIWQAPKKYLAVTVPTLLSYCFIGGPSATRTRDHRIKSPVHDSLFSISYTMFCQI